MSVLSAQVIFPNRTALAKDATVNTLHFGTTGPAVDALSAVSITAAIVDFFNADPVGADSPLGSHMSPGIDRPNCRIKIYRLNDPKPRIPLSDEPWTLIPSVGNAIPSEVAVVASFQAAKVSGLSQASRRNRIFVGALNTTSMIADAQGNARVHNEVITSLLNAMNRLWVASDLDANWTWVANSPKLGILSTAAIRDGWVDNEFDTQRRRGVKATVRSTRVFV